MHAFKTSKIGVLALALAATVSSQAFAGPITLTTLFGGPIADGVPNPDPDPDASPSIAVDTNFLFLDSNASEFVQSIQSITLTNLTHLYSSDLSAALTFIPNDPMADTISAPLFDSLNEGGFFIANDLNGTYSFSNSAAQTLQEATGPDSETAIIPSGTYLPSALFGTDEAPTPQIQNLTAIFAGLNLADGTFVVTFTDFVPGDTGSLGSATLNLTTVVPEPASLATLALAGGAMLRRRRATIA